MDERKDKDFSGCPIMESCEEKVSDHVATEKTETTEVLEHIASEVQFQSLDGTTGSSAEGVVADESMSCNGDETIVGVMGSDIRVDGVCMLDSGNGGGGNLNQEAIDTHGAGLVSVKEVRDSDGGGSEANITDAGVDGSNSGTNSEVGKSPGLLESLYEGKFVEDEKTVGKGGITDVGTLQGVGDEDEDVLKMSVGSVVEGSTGEEIQDVADKAVVASWEQNSPAEKEKLDQTVKNSAGDSSPGETEVVISAQKSESSVEATNLATETNGSRQDEFWVPETQKGGVFCDDTWKPIVGPTGETSSTVKDDSSADTGVVEESVVMADNKHSSPKIDAALEVTHDSGTVEGVIPCSGKDSATENVVFGSLADETKVVISVQTSEHSEVAANLAKEANGNGGDVLQALKTQNSGVFHDDTGKPGIGTTGAPSSTIMDDSSADTRVVEEKCAVMINNKNLSPKIEAALESTHESDAVRGVIPCSEKDLVSTERDAAPISTSDFVDGQMQVAVAGKIASIGIEEIGSPNIEGMDTDTFNENFYFSVEELQGTSETANGSTENRCDAFADLQSSQKPAHVVVGGEIVETEDKMLLSSEKSIPEDCSDSKGSHTSLQVHLNIGPERDEQATDAEQAGTLKEQSELETSKERIVNHGNMCVDSMTSCQPNGAVDGNKVAVMDDVAHSDHNSKGPVHVQLDQASSSGDNWHLKTETVYKEADVQTTSMCKDKVLNSASEVPQPDERDEELKQEECADKNTSCQSVECDVNIGDLVDSQEQITHVEELGEERKNVMEQHPETATICMSTKTDSHVGYGGKTTAMNNDMTVDPNTELMVPAEGDQYLKVEERLGENAVHDVFDIESDMRKETAVQGHVADAQATGFHDGEEIEAEEQDTDSEQPKTTDKSAKQETLNPGNTVRAHQAIYQLPLDDDGEFSVSDLVWGKVRSHPWWPGQIFDPSDASEKAMKYQKKDCFLVAYFGDRTFAWNEASLLRPFRSTFSQDEKQSNSETFQNAVNCALEEVSRRVEFGLACTCMPRDTYDEIIFQTVENAGIQEESSVRNCMDKSSRADLFEPSKLVDYMKALAKSPAGGADRLGLVIAKSQLLPFYRLKGYSQLPEFQFCGELLENADILSFQDEVTEDASPVYKNDGQTSSSQATLQIQRSSYRKRKHNLKDTIYPRKKERSLSDLMGESWDSADDEIGSDGKANNKLISPSSGKKQRGSDSFPDDQSTMEGRKTTSLAKLSTHTVPKPSFKIGECIRRVASQMTGSPSILKSNVQKQDGGSDGLIGDGSDVFVQHSEDPEMKRMNVPTEYSSLNDVLSQLQLAAQDPLKEHSFLNVIISFFSDFRNTVTIEKHDKVGGKRRQTSHSIGGPPETFEFEDMNDTYWTDRVIQDGSDEPPPRKSRKRDTQHVSVDPDKPLNRSYSRKRYSDGNSGVSTEKSFACVDENAPAELVMHFPVVDSVPSEMSLNKMFRRFGPLKEYETETDRDTNRARVVFKKSSDAEAAYGSAPTFNIFGSTLVNYQLNYTVSVPFKTQLVVAPSGEEDEALFLQY